MNCRYTYLRDEHRFPVACVAMLYDKSKKQVCIGISTVHPNDKQTSYSKELARSIAKGRAELTPIIIEDIESMIPGIINTHDILHSVMQEIERNKELPIRVRKAAIAWFVKAEAKQTADQANQIKATGSVNTSYFNASYNPLLEYSSDLVPSLLDYKSHQRSF